MTYTVSGTNLTATVLINAPTGVELSSDSGSSWHSSLMLSPTSGTLASTLISVRLVSTATVGPVSGTVTNTSTGVTEKDVSVSGSVLSGDQFNGANAPNLGPNWTAAGGQFVIQNGKAVVTSTTVTALVVFKGTPVADVAVEADVSLGTTGDRVGVVARYTPATKTVSESYYWGRLIRQGAKFFAELWRYNHGTWTQLGPSVAVSSGDAHLRLEVFGSSLKLFVNGTITVWANDQVLTQAGQVGMRAQTASLDNFQNSPLTVMNATPGFNDPFDTGTDGNTQLSLSWTQQSGDFALAGGRVTGNDTSSLATLNGLSVLNTQVGGHVTVNAKSNSAGFVADYVPGSNGAANASYYSAYLAEDSLGHYSVNVVKVLAGATKTFPGGKVALPTSFNGAVSHNLVFQIQNGSLSLSIDGASKISLTDPKPLAAGTVGLLGTKGQTFDDFMA
jgi:hypothetical protein